MKKLVLYIHGQGGSPEEAAHYRPLLPGSDVKGLDYKARTPWEAAEELPRLYDRLSTGYDTVTLIANSIGAYFAMAALSEKNIARALFISPVVDMEKLITDMMGWAGVTEDRLRREGEIPTDFGETLSWDYLCYVRAHPVRWRVPTHILYGGKGHLTSREIVSAFSARIGAPLTVMEDGEHWFHTEEQMAFLDGWLRAAVQQRLWQKPR